MGREPVEAEDLKADLTLGKGSRKGIKKVEKLGESILDCNPVLKEFTKAVREF